MKSMINKISVAIILLTCAAAVFYIPAHFTRIVFDQGVWLAKAMVYLCALSALAYGIVDYRLHIRLYHWIKKRFGIKLY